MTNPSSSSKYPFGDAGKFKQPEFTYGGKRHEASHPYVNELNHALQALRAGNTADAETRLDTLLERFHQPDANIKNFAQIKRYLSQARQNLKSNQTTEAVSNISSAIVLFNSR